MMLGGGWIKHWSWLNLRFASGVQERLRRRLTPGGQAVLAATLAAGLFGIDTRQTAASQLFALGTALLAVDLMIGWRRPTSLIARRCLPRHASAGDLCPYRVQLTNTGRRPLRGLTLRERLADPRPDRTTFLRSRAPVEAGLNTFERLFGYPRWEWLVRQGRGAEPPAAVPLPDLAPGEAVELILTLTPTRRGQLQLPALVAARIGPLGLARRESVAAGGERLLVLPRRWPVHPQPPPGRRRLQPGGITLTSSVGESPEFIGLRDYLPGDSPRHIHWAGWARCGEPVVKEYQDEWFSRQALVLDTALPGAASPASRPVLRRRQVRGTPVDPHAAFECAVSVAASLVQPLTAGAGRQDSLLDLIFVADRAHTVTTGRGLLGADALLTILATLEPGPADGFAALAETVSATASRLSACLLVLLSWDRPRRQLVERLRVLGTPVRVLLIEPGPAAGGELGADAEAAGSSVSAEAGDPVRIDPAEPGAGLARFR